MTARALLQLLAVLLVTLALAVVVIVLVPLARGTSVFPILARLWSRMVLRILGVRLEVDGVGRVDPSRAGVFISNHESLLDPPALLLAIPADVRAIAKRSLFFIPIFGQALWAGGIIPIDRSHRERAIASMRRAALRVRNGAFLLVFPEGTRREGGQTLRPFKKGAFLLAIEAQAPIYPVVVRGARRLLPPGALFCRPGTVRITFLPAVGTTGLSSADRDRLIQDVARRMQECLTGRSPARQAAR
ncbi:MAG: lysophospholipid acyltransferase family protein [Acidobacteriota bacterium]